MTTDRGQKLWEEVKDLQDADATFVLNFLCGWMERNDDFFKGVETALRYVKGGW